ncbi:MAG: hypothetical protein QUS33_11760 [Dehalococcoidia bacterium]|nr:hypothetical protein [Dehalococcoidia bacterium]
MTGITCKRIYRFGQEYGEFKVRVRRMLGEYLGPPNPVVVFNDADRSIAFLTERLVPAASTKRPLVMLLFSNPHPLSIRQGMFLSPNRRNRENPFWSAMKEAGWLEIAEEKPTPERLANICLKASYKGPFTLAFYCYYAFPTDSPRDIRMIFGEKYFSERIEPEASGEFRQSVEQSYASAVVTFNKEIFNLVSGHQIRRYVDDLKKGRLIQGQIKGIVRDIPVFLTYPTGWRYDTNYMQLRKASLDEIRIAISSKVDTPDTEGNPSETHQRIRRTRP